MGSRSRSIRLRIYSLVAIPLVAMVGLLAYVAGTSISNAISLDRAPNLVNATAIPAAKFATYLQNERAAAVVYLFKPTAANLQAYEAAIAATDRAEPAFTAAMASPATVGTETASAVKQIDGIEADLSQLPTLRDAVRARSVSGLDALAAYSGGMAAEAKLFLLQTESVHVTNQLSQAIGLVAAVQAQEQLSQEDALLAGMLAGQRMTHADRAAFTDMAAARQADAQYADFILSPANLASYNAPLAGTGTMQQDLANIEQAIAAGTPVAKLPVTQAQWQALARALLQGAYKGGVAVAGSILVADHHNSHAAWVNVAVTSGVVLLALLVTILFTTLIGRSIIRRLRELERSALTLAEDQLPDVVARLRRGEDVDVAAEAPPLRVGGDEIGRVGQAFGLVRQTAIRAAVEEAKLRRGLNDVFRSLARRSQSLLHRQLSLLDQMERRATDPEALDDLFRLDHLTTRMRRHAEGLVILAGAPPGRGWSSPVRMVDVMRGAIAEVEDYARVSVATRSQAALAGSAVADVIHLLAELIENATTMSPPYTSVRVSGDTVANGFAIEVEDRGLGMSSQRLAELNERLASPPEFNPSDSEQLGLFVVSQLAKRHGIKVTLKTSPFGGTSAVVLIPRHLVVTEDAFRAGLPGGEPAAIGVAPPGTNGNHVADMAGAAPFLALPDASELGLPEAPGVRISGALRRSQGGDGVSHGAHAAPARAGAGPQPGVAGLPRQAGTALPIAGAGPIAGARSIAGQANDTEPANDAAPASSTEPPEFDVFVLRRPGQGPSESQGFAEAGPDRAPGFPPYPGRASYPGAGPAPYPDQPGPFPAWTGGGTGLGSPRPAAPGPGDPAAPATPMNPVASPRTGAVSGPPWEVSRRTGPLPVVPAGADPGSQAADPGSQAADPGADGDLKGLPRRVKQASLAPQLRADPPRRRSAVGTFGPGPAGGPTPAEIRQTMSSLQRGWQVGRLQSAAGPVPDVPAAGPVPSSGQDPFPGAGQAQEPPAAGGQARGDSDGT